MAFLDKLNTIAKNVGGTASDALETGKLALRIRNEKAAIDDAKKRLGEYYYAKHVEGEVLSPDAVLICGEIDTAKAMIESLEVEMGKLKTNVSDGFSTMFNTEEAQDADSFVEEQICSNCGAVVPFGKKFCEKCGTMYGAAEEPEAKKCPTCGAEIADGTSFCGVCGAKID